MGARMTQERVGQARWRAIRYQRPAPGLSHPSDRGRQYGALDYQRLLQQHGLLASRSGQGHGYDNAPRESCWGSLKTERVPHQR